MHKVGCAIPVKGRIPLLELTIKRLQQQSYPVTNIVIMGDNPEEENLAKKLGVDFIQHANKPLGAKWQAGYTFLHQKYDIDAFVIAGSSDWLSDNWVETMMRHYNDASIGMVGTAGCYFYDIGKTQRRLCYWGGYTERHVVGNNHNRINEPIGIGRMLFRPCLEKLNWQIFSATCDHSLDWNTFKLVSGIGLNSICINASGIASCSISHYGWPNKHSFDRELAAPTAHLVEDYASVMDKYFPEHRIIQ